MPTIQVIHPNGVEETTMWDKEGRPDYRQLQKLVGGLIQPVHSFMLDYDEYEDDVPNERRIEAYVSETGIIDGLEPNYPGSKKVNWPVGKLDCFTGRSVPPLYGPVVILRGFPADE